MSDKSESTEVKVFEQLGFDTINSKTTIKKMNHYEWESFENVQGNLNF